MPTSADQGERSWTLPTLSLPRRVFPPARPASRHRQPTVANASGNSWGGSCASRAVCKVGTLAARALAPLCGLLACLALAGCAGSATPPEQRAAPPAIALPHSWYREAPAGANADLSGWWSRFGDPMLADLVERALQHNTSLAAATARLQQARAVRDVAAAGLKAQVGTVLSAESTRQRTVGVRNSYRAGVDASWEPDLYGYRAAGLAASAASLEAEELTLADGQVSLAAEVALNYIELRGVQHRQAVARAHVFRHWLVWTVAGQGGSDAALDQERARAALALALAELSHWRSTLAQLEHGLALLCGAAPGTLALEQVVPGALPQAPGDLALRLPADTLRQRPDVRAAAARVDAALARLGQAEAARKPVVRLEGSIGLQGLRLGGSGGSVLRGLFGAISGIAFDGGAGRARVEAEQAALQESYAEYRSAVLGALREVEDALASLAAEQARRSALAIAVDSARRAALLALLAYREGRAALDAVQASQAVLLDSEDALVQATVAESTSHVRLYKALGGGWQTAAAAE
jgi:outer membrane protein, multidrug efflux system